MSITLGTPRGVAQNLAGTVFGQVSDVHHTQLADGRFVAVWTERSAATNSSDIRAVVLNADGTPAGDPFTVNTTTDFPQLNPQAHALPDGGFVILWDSFGQDDFTFDPGLSRPWNEQYGLYQQVFDASGTPQGGETLINEGVIRGSQYQAQINDLPGGGYVVTWVHHNFIGETVPGDFFGQTLYHRAFDANGVPIAAPVQSQIEAEFDHAGPDPATVSPNYNAPVEVLADGTLAHVWSTILIDSLFVSVTSVDGTVLSQVDVLDSVPADIDAPSFFGVELLSDGRLAIAFAGSLRLPTGGTNQDVYILLTQPDGSDAQLVNVTNTPAATSHDFSAVDVHLLPDGSLLVTWLSFADQRLEGQIVGADGTLIGDTMVLSPEHVRPTNIQITVVDAETFAVTYETEGFSSELTGPPATFQLYHFGDGAAPGAATADDDAIDGTAGADTIDGLAGDDGIDAGGGNDLAEGGDGNDAVFGGNGNDTLGGGEGNDQLVGGAGDDSASGGAGDDTLSSLGGADTLDGGAGHDVLEGSGGGLLTGGDGNDTISAGDGDVVRGDAGDDVIINPWLGSAQISGGAGDDFVITAPSVRLISGGEGIDTLYLQPSNGDTFRNVAIDLVTGQFGTEITGTFGAVRDFEVIYFGAAPMNIRFWGQETADVVSFNSGASNLLATAQIFGRGGDDFFEDRYDGTGFLDPGEVTIEGGAGNDTILGGDSHNRFDGGAGQDLILSGTQADVLAGGSGDDTLTGGAGRDTLSGGAGNDLITGGTEGDLLVFEGDWGDDTVTDGSAIDTVEIDPALIADMTFVAEAGGTRVTFAGSSNSILFEGMTFSSWEGLFNTAPTELGVTNDVVEEFAPAGTIVGSLTSVDAEGDTVTYELDYSGDFVPFEVIDGNIVVFSSFDLQYSLTPSYTVSIIATDAHGATTYDTVTINIAPPAEPIEGTVGNDDLTGTNDAEALFGFDGDDTITARRGDDTVDAGAGNDSVMGLGGNDSLTGGLGADTIRGGRENDWIEGGDGSDALYGQRNRDTVIGGEGDDIVNGGGGADVVVGDAGNDYIRGGTHRDTMTGGEGSDTLIGNRHDDLLDGGFGNDTLNGGGDNDTLAGGEGDDWMRGGAGADTFYFGSFYGHDVIDDYNGAEDILRFDEVFTDGGGSVNDILANTEVTSEGLVIHFGDEASVLLVGVTSVDQLGEIEIGFL